MKDECANSGEKLKDEPEETAELSLNENQEYAKSCAIFDPSFEKKQAAKPSDEQTITNEINNNRTIEKYQEEKKNIQITKTVYENIEELHAFKLNFDKMADIWNELKEKCSINEKLKNNTVNLNCEFLDNATEVKKLNTTNFENSYASGINFMDNSESTPKSPLEYLEKSIDEVDKQLDEIIEDEILKNKIEPKKMVKEIELNQNALVGVNKCIKDSHHKVNANFDLVDDMTEKYSWDSTNCSNRFSDEIMCNKQWKEINSSPFEDLENSIIEIEIKLDEIIKNTI